MKIMDTQAFFMSMIDGYELDALYQEIKTLREKIHIKKDVKAVYKFPNGMVATCDFDGKQIPELQGKYSKELHEKIFERSSYLTEWRGFYE